MNSMMNVAQVWQGLIYWVCSITIPNVAAFGSFILVFGTSAIMHQHLVAMLRGYMRFVYTYMAECSGITFE